MDDVVTRREFNEYVKRMETEHENIHRRYGDINKQLAEVNRISISVEKLALNMEHMLDELQRQRETQIKHDERIENLESRDGEMWRKLVGYAVTCVAGILIGYIFKLIGM